MARERKYEVPTGDEIDYAEDFAKWEEKGPTAKQKLFGEWVAEKTGAADRFKTQKEVAAFQQGVELALKYRMHFQRSPENHAQDEQLRGEREDAAEAAAAEREERKAARAAKREAPAEDEAPKPRRGRKPAAAPAEEAAPAPRRGRRAAAKAEDEAPAKPAGRRPGRPATKAAGDGARRPAASRPARPARRGSTAEAEF